MLYTVIESETIPEPNPKHNECSETNRSTRGLGWTEARGARSVGMCSGEMGALGRGNGSTRLYDRDHEACDHYVSGRKGVRIESR